MDFKRIETILVLTFLALNIFLLSTYFDKNYNDFYQNSSNSELNFVDEMNKSNIKLPVFQNEKNKVPYIQAETNELLTENHNQLSNQTGVIEENGSIYSSILSNPIVLSEDKNLTSKDIEKLNDFVKSDQVLFGSEYQFFRYLKSNQQIVYVQIANNIPITDGTSEIVFHLDSNKKVISYEQNYAGPVTVQGDSRELITDKNAVDILYQNNEISADITVKKPILSYYRTLNLEELSMYAPVWYVEVVSSTDTQVKRVDAINGSILKSSMLDMPHSDEKDKTSDKESAELRSRSDSSS
ncbi:two-component system regulatory protein YycI [Carnobacterium mobile]|uniref:two-component system regulatory protein YycI n=1 Tax=Carnobacterium mobile TaxID=2750 RepID=UPI0018682AB4|nr:two-component system regulatory protein YycI [Carnobacterium mobile]